MSRTFLLADYLEPLFLVEGPFRPAHKNSQVEKTPARQDPSQVSTNHSGRVISIIYNDRDALCIDLLGPMGKLC